jgi:TetR/AcrR family transcriptional regulator, regulator of cefoperazone and chloramphenicol sensitivity
MPPAKSGFDPKARLIEQAALLFAERGFEGVTTREICAAAGVNPGAIHYHFGDKEGLYREVLRQPIDQLTSQFEGYDAPGLSLAEALHRFLAPFLMMGGEQDQTAMRLHLRELLDPSPVFAATIASQIGPKHHAFARLLAQHIGIHEPDTATHQLAYALIAMAHDYCLSRAFMEALTPDLLAEDPQLAALHRRLVDWGCALVAFERERRKTA